jgi:hypothetical protein
MDVGQPSTTETFSQEEKAAMDQASESIMFGEGRYQIGIPWKNHRPDLPDNRAAAERRLRSLESSLRKKPLIAQHYQKVFEENIKKGYLRKVPPEEVDQPGWYLPHFGVVREDRVTTTKSEWFMTGQLHTKEKA